MTPNTVEFHGTNYQFSGAVIQDGAINIADLTGAKLVELHNLLNANLGIDKRVNKFADKKTAIIRVTTKLEEYDNLPEETTEVLETTPSTEKPAKEKRTKGESPSAINYLGMRVDIRFQDEQIALKREGSIRAVALKKLIEGATLKDLEKIFGEFDAKRGVIGKDPIRRSYEMIRIFCYHYGYGTSSSEDGKTIKLVTE